MKFPKTLFQVVLIAIASACDRATGPSGDPPVAPPFANVASGCYTVSFGWNGTPSGATTFTGSLTGDLQGTLTTDLDFSTIRITGSTMSVSGTGYWEITGGVVQSPLSFETTIANRNQLADRPGSPGTMFENIGTHSSTTGISKAYLAYTGTFTAIPSPETNHDYRGVICP